EGSTRICARCTKDACDNHLCEKCLRCSDCCECEVSLDETPRPVVRPAVPEPPPAPSEPVKVVADQLLPEEPEPVAQELAEPRPAAPHWEEAEPRGPEGAMGAEAPAGAPAGQSLELPVEPPAEPHSEQ